MLVHGVFPYLCVLLERGEYGEQGFGNRFLQALEGAMRVGEHGSKCKEAGTIVFDVSVEEGRSFYGYAPKKQMFLRVRFMEQAFVKMVRSSKF